MKKNENKILRWQLVMSVAMVIFGCALIATAFFVPPTGEIHPSVLTAFGEILTFVGAIVGVDYSYKKVIHKHDEDDGTES